MKPCDNDICNALSYSKFEAHEYPNMINNRRWDSVSSQAQNLVLKLLERDALKRLTAEQVRPPKPSQQSCARCLALVAGDQQKRAIDGCVQALQRPFLRRGATTATDSQSGIRPIQGHSDDLLAASIKETDQLQADEAFKDTAEQERWRDLADTINQARLRACTCNLPPPGWWRAWWRLPGGAACITPTSVTLHPGDLAVP